MIDWSCGFIYSFDLKLYFIIILFLDKNRFLKSIVIGYTSQYVPASQKVLIMDRVYITLIKNS